MAEVVVRRAKLPLWARFSVASRCTCQPSECPLPATMHFIKCHISCQRRCTRSGLKQITCPSGLAFDLDKQTCDWKGKVTNCDKLESKCRKEAIGAQRANQAWVKGPRRTVVKVYCMRPRTEGAAHVDRTEYCALTLFPQQQLGTLNTHY